jgi:hypothetical protein
MYLLLRLQQILCCCCCRPRRIRVYSETVDQPHQDDFGRSGGSGDSTIDLENTDGLGTVPPPGKINLDYDEDDEYARRVRTAAALEKASKTGGAPRAKIVMQIVDRDDWLNDSLVGGETAVMIICTAFGPLLLDHPIASDNGCVTYTVSEVTNGLGSGGGGGGRGNGDGVIDKWADQSNWPSVASLFKERVRVLEVTRLKK